MISGTDSCLVCLTVVGHFFEQLKVVRQAEAKPYLDIIKDSYRRGGLFDVMYRGCE